MNRIKLLNEAASFVDAFLALDLKKVKLSSLDSSRTAIVVVDMVNGFAEAGALYSPRVRDIIAPIAALLDQAREMHKIFFLDAHPAEATEFDVFPPHCIKGTAEADLHKDLKDFVDDMSFSIDKNSTNGYLEPIFQTWLRDHPEIDTFVVVGCCTDLCVSQFGITLKTHFNRLNKSSRIMMPMNAVETYDLSVTNHPGDLMQLFSMKQMIDNGIEIVAEVL